MKTHVAKFETGSLAFFPIPGGWGCGVILEIRPHDVTVSFGDCTAVATVDVCNKYGGVVQCSRKGFLPGAGKLVGKKFKSLVHRELFHTSHQLAVTQGGAVVGETNPASNRETLMAVYLLHFESRINVGRPAQHYIGYAGNVEKRNVEHLAGRGAAITRHAVKLGIGWQVVREWQGDRKFERSLKRLKDARALW